MRAARRSERVRSDRAATLIEFALVVPLLLILAFGTAEMGLAWTTSNRVEGATSTAGRIASSSGSLDEADLNVLLSLQASLPAKSLENLDRVVIFRANSAGTGQPPSLCVPPVGDTTRVVQSDCNSYPGDQVRSVTQTSPLTNLPGTGGWLPSSRRDRLADPPDYIGVWVRTRHDNQTGTYFGDFIVTKTSIYRIQPDIDG